jgi:hypothetical protein
MPITMSARQSFAPEPPRAPRATAPSVEETSSAMPISRIADSGDPPAITARPSQTDRARAAPASPPRPAASTNSPLEEAPDAFAVATGAPHDADRGAPVTPTIPVAEDGRSAAPHEPPPSRPTDRSITEVTVPIVPPGASPRSRDPRIVSVKDARVERPRTLPPLSSARDLLARSVPAAAARKAQAPTGKTTDPNAGGEHRPHDSPAAAESPRPATVARGVSISAARAAAAPKMHVPEPMAPPTAPEPTLSIGQIDVTVVHQPPRPAAPRPPSEARPADSLATLLPARGLKWFVYKP